MPTPNDRLKYLLNQYANQASTQDEENELFELLNTVSETDVEPLLIDILEQTEPKPDAERRERILAKINLTLSDRWSQPSQSSVAPEREGLKTPKVRKMFMWKKIAIAASIVGLLLVAGYWLFEIPRSARNDKQQIAVVHEVEAPKTNRATVTTSDGKTIYLDSVSNGQLAVQNNVTLTKTADGKIEYSQESALRQAQGNKEIAYHTLNNPRGSKVVDITLVDGSHVWLNAGSSIIYPVAFVGNERKISMTGEAYFEVNPHPLKGSEKVPFFVEANGTTTEVLGTHFNVNAYNDEDAVRVTLLEGSVRVSKSNGANGSVDIKPGQQAVSMDNGKLKIESGVSVEEVMAWKNGLFSMHKADIGSIMRQISRWYDVDIEYQNGIPKGTISGDVPRNLNLSEVLKVYEYSGVHFEIEEKKVVVKP